MPRLRHAASLWSLMSFGHLVLQVMLSLAEHKASGWCAQWKRLRHCVHASLRHYSLVRLRDDSSLALISTTHQHTWPLPLSVDGNSSNVRELEHREQSMLHTLV